MNNNDLACELEKICSITKDDLLENYKYGNYSGDANCKEKGQAIIKFRRN